MDSITQTAVLVEHRDERSVEREVREALAFTPALTGFILATTGPADVKVQQRARELCEEHRTKGLFSVEVWSWEKIWHEIYGRKELLRSIGPVYWPLTWRLMEERLKQHADYAADWETVFSESRHRMENLPSTIGGLVPVERRDLLNAIANKMEKCGCVALLGGSGNGKSVIARTWATEGNGNVVWLRANDLSATGGLRALFRLAHGVADLLASAGQPIQLVLDGLDKCFDECAFDETALVLRATATEESKDRWQTLLTCCPEDWERVRCHLMRRGIALTGGVVRVGHFTKGEVREVCREVPSLRPLAQRPHLYPILCWPKALDIAATYWRASGAAESWATESDFARWFWKSAICQEKPASVRDRVARKLAAQLGDRMAASAPLDGFTHEEFKTLAELAHEGHVEIDANRCNARFTHELIADWARQRELLVQGEAAGTFLRTRLHSPLWHRAVRFHGLALLEQQPGSDAWQRLFLTFSGEATVDHIAQNLMLEAPIFAFEQVAALERLWPLFQLDTGGLLRRFLRQFLRVATLPDEHIVAGFPAVLSGIRTGVGGACRPQNRAW